MALEVFMQVWRNAASYNSDLSEPLTWVLMITKRRAIDRKRIMTKKLITEEQFDENLATAENGCFLLIAASEENELLA